MKLLEIFRFEFAYQIRRVPTWLFFAVLGVIAFLMVRTEHISNAASGDYQLNAPYVVALTTVFGSLLSLLVAASVAGEAGARDVQTRMHPLTYTAPLTKLDYLGGRYLAALALNVLILAAIPAGIFFGAGTAKVAPEVLGPFRAAGYSVAWFFIALPNALIATAIQFSIGVLLRRAALAYLGSVLVFVIAYIGAGSLAAMGMREQAKLLDPIGVITIVSTLANTWTPLEKNTRLISLEGVLLANRLLWVGVALGALAFTYWRFHFVHESAEGWWTRLMLRRRLRQSALAVTGDTGTPVPVPQVRQTFDFRTRGRQTLAIASVSFRQIVRSWSWLLPFAFVALVLTLVVPYNIELLGVPLYARTEHVLRHLIAPLGSADSPLLLLPLLIAYWTGELLWRERDAGLNEITDAIALPEWVPFLGKFLGLGLVLAAWVTMLTVCGMIIQTRLGGTDIEVGLYLKMLLGLQLVDYLLFVLLVLVIQVLVNHKHLGILVALLTYGCILFPAAIGIEHRLLVYGSDPGWTYTDMRGFGPFLGPWMAFKLYWAAAALLLALIAHLLWVRGKEGGVLARLRQAWQRFTPGRARVAGLAGALLVTFGSYIFYNTNVLNEYRTGAQQTAQRAEYERRYGQYASIPQPVLKSTSLQVEFHPRQRTAEVRGTYGLVNKGTLPIDSIHLATAAEVETGEVSFDRAATLARPDEGLHHRIYALQEPLKPGESLQLRFHVRSAPKGFRHNGVNAAVVENGTYFKNSDWLPSIGYQFNRELRDAGERQAHGLPPRPLLPALEDDEGHRPPTRGERIDFEAVVGTEDGQTALAPGLLRRTWTEAARRYFHYSTDAPIGNEYSLYSARYAVREGCWNDVAIEVFHHPGHSQNVDRMLRSVQASLSHFTKQYGPYPYGVFRLVEYPGHGVGAHADASVMTFQEGFMLMNPEENGLDLPFYVVAHEVAHQWWGAQLGYAPVEGTVLLIEGLATYSGMQVLRQEYGEEHMGRFLWVLWNAYEVPRSRAAVPLLRADNGFLGRRKGPRALHALSSYIGIDKVNGAFRSLLEKHLSGALPLPTSLDLYRELQAVTPDSCQILLHDLFEANTFWELKMEGVSAEQAKSGDWQVKLEVNARKVIVDETGVETEVPMDDLIEVAVYAAVEGSDKSAPLYLSTHPIRSGKQSIMLTVPRKPARAGIDPNNLLIDLDTGDNFAETKS